MIVNTGDPGDMFERHKNRLEAICHREGRKTVSGSPGDRQTASDRRPDNRQGIVPPVAEEKANVPYGVAHTEPPQAP